MRTSYRKWIFMQELRRASDKNEDTYQGDVFQYGNT